MIIGLLLVELVLQGLVTQRHQRLRLQTPTQRILNSNCGCINTHKTPDGDSCCIIVSLDMRQFWSTQINVKKETSET